MAARFDDFPIPTPYTTCKWVNRRRGMVLEGVGYDVRVCKVVPAVHPHEFKAKTGSGSSESLSDDTTEVFCLLGSDAV